MEYILTLSHVFASLSDPRWTLVELIPDLYMERVYEDHENLVENCLMWTVDSKNTLWFIERPEKYDVFVRPERYLLGTSSSQQGDTMEDHARQELLEEYFSSTGNYTLFHIVAHTCYFSTSTLSKNVSALLRIWLFYVS